MDEIKGVMPDVEWLKDYLPDSERFKDVLPDWRNWSLGDQAVETVDRMKKQLEEAMPEKV